MSVLLVPELQQPAGRLWQGMLQMDVLASWVLFQIKRSNAAQIMHAQTDPGTMISRDAAARSRWARFGSTQCHNVLLQTRHLLPELLDLPAKSFAVLHSPGMLWSDADSAQAASEYSSNNHSLAHFLQAHMQPALLIQSVRLV